MTSPRERALAEGLIERLIGIQKSTQINKRIAMWEEHVLEMDEREIKRVSMEIAERCELFFEEIELSGEESSVPVMERRIKEELRRI